MATLKTSNKKLHSALAEYGEAMAGAASEEIIRTIANIPKIGPFLAVRTKIDTVISGNTITLFIQGMSESEAGFPGVKGGQPDGDMNLWLAHEFGTPSDGHTSRVNFQKDSGGVGVVRQGVAHGAGSPYVGVIHQTVANMTLQLEELCLAIAGIGASSVASELIETGTRGKVQVANSAQAALKRAGVSEGMLATLGVNKVTVTGRGQINYHGSNAKGGHFFVSGKNSGIPTSIHR